MPLGLPELTGITLQHQFVADVETGCTETTMLSPGPAEGASSLCPLLSVHRCPLLVKGDLCWPDLLSLQLQSG